MPKKILFSPIGGTDPIKYERDGSMLHICRHYLPDVVYLYMSSEMLYYHEKDNRYVNSIEWLGNFLGHKFEVHLIERPELRNAHEYDVFYEDIPYLTLKTAGVKISFRVSETTMEYLTQYFQ